MAKSGSWELETIISKLDITKIENNINSVKVYHSTSGRIETPLAKNSRFYFQWQQVSQNIGGIYTDISWQAGLKISGYDEWYLNAVKINNIYIDSKKVFNGGTWSNISGNDDHQLTTGTERIYHDINGNKNFSASISGWLYDFGNREISGSWELETIISKLDITKIENDINSVKVYYSTQGSVTDLQYKLSPDTFKRATITNPLIIKNLQPNTNYSIQLAAVINNSSNFIYSDTQNFKMDDIAKLVETSSFNLGDSTIVKIDNPKNISTRLDIMIGSTLITSKSNISSSYTLTFSQNELDNMYKLFGNANSVDVMYKLISSQNSISYDNTVIKKINLTGNTYCIKLKLDNEIKRGKIWIGTVNGNKRGIITVGSNGNKRGL